MKITSVRWLLVFLLAITIPQLAFAGKKKIKKEMDSWVGATKEQLIQGYGPPSYTTSNGADGEIVIFSQRVYQEYPTYTTGPNGVGLEVNGYRANDYYIHKMYYINSSGTVYHWRYERSPNPPERLNVNMNVNSTLRIRP